MISEFTQYDIGEEEMDEMLDHLDEDSRLYYKLKDIRLLYEGFQDYLRERYITKEELLDVLNSQGKESELLKSFYRMPCWFSMDLPDLHRCRTG